MRCAAVALVVALLLPGSLAQTGPSGLAAPSPLGFFGDREKPAASTAPALVVEVYYNTLRADEYVVITNVGDTAIEVAGWTITDGEGTLTFPAGSRVAPNARTVVAQNSTMYDEDTFQRADFQYAGGDAPAMGRSGTFQLRNSGDEVVLRDPTGAIADVLAYGDSPYDGVGWMGAPAAAVGRGYVARRDFAMHWQDTNGSADWDLVRVRSLGQSEFPPAAFAFSGTATAFATPDDAFDGLYGLLRNATATVDLCLYTFDGLLESALRFAAGGPGVRVRILLEGAPVGGIDREEWIALQSLGQYAEVHFMVDNTTLDVQERYRFLHAKYAIVDNRTVIVSTENWGKSAFPSWDSTGSRGWLVAVNHAPLAAYFARVFEADFDARRRDVVTLQEMSITAVEPRPATPRPRPATFPPRSFSGSFRVVPVLGPDTSLSNDTILGLLRSARESVHVEMFYAHTAWGPFPNPYLDELLADARRGVRVRLLLDSSRFNVDENDPIDNDDTVRHLNALAAAERLNLQAKLVDLEAHGFTQLHTKGLVVDGRTVLVSSVNWNRNSPTANREAGLLIENEGLTAYFETVFAWDWKDDVTPPVADAGPDRDVLEGETVTLSGLGSSDDVAVTNYSWDFDGDGTFDAWGPEVSTAYRYAGAYVVRLRVSDSWNNTAEDTANVTARPSPKGAPPGIVPVGLLAFAALVVLVVLVFLLARRRKKGINKPF